MTEKTNSTETKENKKTNAERDLILLSLFLLLNVGFFVMLFIGFYDAEHPQHTAVWTIYLVFALYNLIALVGILYRRGFGKTLTEILLIFDFVMNIRYPWMLVSLILTLLAYSTFQKYKTGVFKEKDKLNKYVYWGMAAALLIPVIFYMNPTLVPKLHQDTGEITKEAITKNDVTICNRINGGGKRQCLTDFAITKKEPSVCTLINWSDDADTCYRLVAVETKNSSLCSLIKREMDRGICYGDTKP